MIDPLMSRAQRAIEEGCANRKRALADQRDAQITELRHAVLESAMSRSELKAFRDNKA